MSFSTTRAQVQSATPNWQTQPHGVHDHYRYQPNWEQLYRVHCSLSPLHAFCENSSAIGLIVVIELILNNTRCCRSTTANTMPVDALATLGVRTSVRMVLIPQSQNIPSPALGKFTLVIICQFGSKLRIKRKDKGPSLIWKGSFVLRTHIYTCWEDGVYAILKLYYCRWLYKTRWKLIIVFFTDEINELSTSLWSSVLFTITMPTRWQTSM